MPFSRPTATRAHAGTVIFSGIVRRAAAGCCAGGTGGGASTWGPGSSCAVAVACSAGMTKQPSAPKIKPRRNLQVITDLHAAQCDAYRKGEDASVYRKLIWQSVQTVWPSSYRRLRWIICAAHLNAQSAAHSFHPFATRAT